MNTHTRSGPLRLWLAMGILFLGMGWLAHHLVHSTTLDGQPEPTVVIDARSSGREAVPPLAQGLDSPVSLADRRILGPGDAGARVAAVQWRLEPLGALASAAVPAGQLALQTRAPGGHWLTHESLEVRPGGAIEFPGSPVGPFEFRVTSMVLESDLFLVDDRGFVSSAATEVVLRARDEPHVAVYSRTTGQELSIIWIAEAASPAPGARPRFDSPGPDGFQVGRRELTAPFPARMLSEMDRPLVSADGYAWLGVPDRVREAGGCVLLRPGYEVIVNVDASAAAPVGGIEALSLVLMEEEAGRWGASSVSVTLTKALASGGKLEEDFHFRGVPVAILSAAAEARWVVEGPGRREQQESARGSGGLSSAGDRVELALRNDRPEEIVEGYIEFADQDLAGRVTGAALYAVGGAVHVDSLFARRLPLGRGLFNVGDGLLRWQCTGLRPGRYALLLQPSGFYCSIEVESTELGLQTLLSEVPPLVSVGVSVADSDGSIITAKRSVGVTAFVVGAGAERPAITRPSELVGDAQSSPTLELHVPRGALCFVDISCAGRSARGEFLAKEGGVHEFRLEPEMRWVTLRRTVPLGEGAEPLRWWQQNVFSVNSRGEEEAIIYRTLTPQGAPGRAAFTAWGLVHEREPTSELEVALPADAGTLLIRGGFAGAGDEVVHVAAGVREVVLASY